MRIPTNLFLSISTVTLPSWRRGLPFMTCRNKYPQDITVLLDSSVHDNGFHNYAIAVIASTTYMIILELFDECSTPSSFEMMVIIDDNANMYILLILLWETE